MMSQAQPTIMWSMWGCLVLRSLCQWRSSTPPGASISGEAAEASTGRGSSSAVGGQISGTSQSTFWAPPMQGQPTQAVASPARWAASSSVSRFRSRWNQYQPGEGPPTFSRSLW